MRIVTLLAAILLATPALAAERLTDAQLDRITAGGFAIAGTSGQFGFVPRTGPANVGIFVNNAGQAGTLIERLSIALATAGFSIDTSGLLGIPTQPGPTNIGIFVNNAGQADTLIDRLSVALTAGGFVVDTSGRLDITAGQAPANIAIFVNDSGQARTRGFAGSGFTIVDTSGRLGANTGFFLTDTGRLFDTPGIPPIVPHSRMAISIR